MAVFKWALRDSSQAVLLWLPPVYAECAIPAPPSHPITGVYMRRLLFPAVALAASFVVAACSSDNRSRETIISPTEPSLAKATTCGTQLGNTIIKDLKALYPTNPTQKAALDL